MVTSSSRLAFSDCYELMERAINDPKGIKVKFARDEDAWHFRVRLHTARRIDRTDNMALFPEGHMMHGKSPYDELVMRIKENTNGEGGYWLRLERISIDNLEIESLADERPQLAVVKSQEKQEEKNVTVIIQPIRFKRRV
jgi:hypothetical protein